MSMLFCNEGNPFWVIFMPLCSLKGVLNILNKAALSNRMNKAPDFSQKMSTKSTVFMNTYLIKNRVTVVADVSHQANPARTSETVSDIPCLKSTSSIVNCTLTK